MKRISYFVLVSGILLLIAPLAESQIDLTEYDSAVLQIDELTSEANRARANYQNDLMIELLRQKRALEEELNTPKMSYLATYSELIIPLDEAEYLIGEFSSVFSKDFSAGDIKSIKDRLTASEAFFSSGNYSGAKEALPALSEIIILPSSLAEEAGATAREDTLSKGDSRILLDAADLFDEASEEYLLGKNSFPKARELTNSGISLVLRSKEVPEQLPYYILFVAIPVIVAGILLFYGLKK